MLQKAKTVPCEKLLAPEKNFNLERLALVRAKLFNHL
jgi:hypothetical protein